tara:strand:+ start:256 stop:453 length:198 start_codon:yes stop_codon:yes gene_type:complete
MKTLRYTIENKSKIYDEWENAFPWQPLFKNHEDAQINLNQWLLGMSMQVGMDCDERNYRIIEVLK